MVLGGTTVHILEFLIRNSYTSSRNSARDMALEEKQSKGLVKTEGEKEIYREKGHAQRKQGD